MTAVRLPAPARRVVAASALANLSDGIRMTALPLVAAAVTKSPTLVALVFAAGQLPWLLFGIWAGGLADRSDRRRLAQGTAALRTFLLFALALLIVADAAHIALILLASFVLGLSEVLADTVNSTLIPMLVGPDDLERANSRMVAAEITGNELIGPALGGVLFAAGASLPFFTNAGLLATALLVLAGLPLLVTTPVSVETAPVQRSRDGLILIRGNPILLALTCSSALLAAVDAAWFALLVLFVEGELDLGASAFGLLLAAGALGGLVGAWLADRYSVRLARISVPIFGSMALSLIALAVSPTVAATAAVLVVTSGAFAIWNVLVVSARQRETPDELLGRVGSAYRTLVIGAAICGAIAGGILASATSIQIALATAGTTLLLAAMPVHLTLRKL